MNVSDYQTLLTPELYTRFREAVALGKWPDGRTLTPQQKQVCLQAIIAYEHRHVPAEERTGYVPSKESACQQSPAEETITWRS